MKIKTPRRDFLKIAAISGISLGVTNRLPDVYAKSPELVKIPSGTGLNNPPDLTFIPRRAASWWVTIEDLQWSQKKIVDKIKRRAAAFAEAKIDTAINFGCHIRFDFSNYFGQLHGYMAQTCEELHQYNIKFMDHYSCNHVERPRNDDEFRKLHRGQRHHTLLFHDPIAAKHAQYEGHLFQDICEVDIRDGSRGYARQYQMEAFCHNNPGFLDMHSKYLQRLVKEVPFDGIEVDDMCDYAGLTTCGCKYCRSRFKKDYGHEIPPFGEKSFWGDTSGSIFTWGNYDNPVFRDWLTMKTDGIVDHVRMVKSIIGNRPLMSCCSGTGPILLNAVSLDLEKMAPDLDFFMLENVGTNIHSVNWVRMDAEAMNQKDIADKRGDVPAIALSYTIYEKGAYFGWALSRYWGVANWSSTLNERLEENPADMMEMEEVICPSNLWEVENSDHDYREGRDLVEIRLVNNKYCRYNGWRDENGKEHWDRSKAWSAHLVQNNVGYRFVRAEELADAGALIKENTPLVLDGVGCISDAQFKAVRNYLSKGGKAWLALPFGTHDEKGFKRAQPLSEQLLKGRYKNLLVIDSAVKSETLSKLISAGRFKPALKQVGGDNGWVAKIRFQKNKPVIHFMNTALIGIPHPTIKDNSGTAILTDIGSKVKNNNLRFEINTKLINLPRLVVLSPELGKKQRPVKVERAGNGISNIQVNLDGIKVYAIAQNL